jgi:hypothetical protein
VLEGVKDLSIHERITPTKEEKAVNAQTDFASLVHISGQKWPPRHRTYFGSLEDLECPPREDFALEYELVGYPND